MTLLRCPNCKSNHPSAEGRDGTCPSCGFAIFPPHNPLPSSSPSLRRWFILVPVWLVIMTITILVLRHWSDDPLPDAAPSLPCAQVSTPPVAAEPLPPAAPAIAIAADPGPALEIPVARDPKPLPPQDAPPRAMPAFPVQPAALVPGEEPLPENRGGNEGEVRNLNDPRGTCRIEPLNGNASIKLTGTIGTLRIASLNGAAVLDASELRATQIIVTDSIDGGTVLRLHAPGGKITLAGNIGGGATLELLAPDGIVALGTGDQNTVVTGGSRLNVVAKDLAIRSTAGGGTRITYTYTRGGSFTFQRMEAGAAVAYRKHDAVDPDLQVTPGELHGGARHGHGGEEIAVMPDFKEPPPEKPRRPSPPQPSLAPPADPAPPREVPMLAAGIILADGTHTPAQVIALDDTQVSFRRADGAIEALPLTRISAVLLCPIPVEQREALGRNSAGLLLKSGDFVEGALKRFDTNRLTLSSPNFGLRSFETRKDVAALLLRQPEKPAPPF